MFPFLPDPQRTGIRPPCLISSFFQRIITCCCGNNLFWNMTEKIILAGLKLSCIAAFTSRWPILFSRKKPSTVCSVHEYRDMWRPTNEQGAKTLPPRCSTFLCPDFKGTFQPLFSSLKFNIHLHWLNGNTLCFCCRVKVSLRAKLQYGRATQRSLRSFC